MMRLPFIEVVQGVVFLEKIGKSPFGELRTRPVSEFELSSVLFDVLCKHLAHELVNALYRGKASSIANRLRLKRLGPALDVQNVALDFNQRD